jgi:MarR family transcriptional regulator, 2-MHQ and catechol-resistance regulon repressor
MSAKSEGSGQAAGFSSPQEEALINLMRTADTLHREMEQRLRPTGLTLTQFNVLRILRAARPAGLTCAAVGRRMVTPVPDVTRLMNRLKAQQLVCQQRDPQDRRVVWSRITEEGLEELSRLDGVVERAPQEFLGHLTRSEVFELTRLLKKARIRVVDSMPANNTVEPFLA